MLVLSIAFQFNEAIIIYILEPRLASARKQPHRAAE